MRHRSQLWIAGFTLSLNGFAIEVFILLRSLQSRFHYLLVARLLFQNFVFALPFGFQSQINQNWKVIRTDERQTTDLADCKVW